MGMDTANWFLGAANNPASLRDPATLAQGGKAIAGLAQDAAHRYLMLTNPAYAKAVTLASVAVLPAAGVAGGLAAAGTTPLAGEAAVTAGGVAAPALAETAATGVAAGALPAAPAATSAPSFNLFAGAYAPPQAATEPGSSLLSNLAGTANIASNIGSAITALRKPKVPSVRGLPRPADPAAAAAEAAGLRRKQALSRYGALSTVKTGPSGLGGSSKLG